MDFNRVDAKHLVFTVFWYLLGIILLWSIDYRFAFAWIAGVNIIVHIDRAKTVNDYKDKLYKPRERTYTYDESIVKEDIEFGIENSCTNCKVSIK